MSIRALCISVVVAIDGASRNEIEEALNFAVDMSRDLSISHTRREVWKQLPRLLRKQLKQY